MTGIHGVLAAVSMAAIGCGGAGAAAPRLPDYPLPAAGEVPRYELEVRLDPAAHRLEGSGSMTVPAAGASRASLRVALTRSMRDFTVRVVAPAGSAGPASVTHEKDFGEVRVWTVRPARPVPAGAPIELAIAWRGGEEVSGAFYLGPDGSFAGGLRTIWYPQILLPEVNNPKATGTLAFRVPAGMTVVGTGAPLSSERERAAGVFRFDARWPTYFSFAAARYTVTRRPGPVAVSLYALRPREAGPFLDGSARVIEALGRAIGPYPFGEFAIVEVPAERAAAAGFSGHGFLGGIFTSSTFLDGGFHLAFYGHEIGHQWFGGLVTAGDGLFDEGMANYVSLHLVETIEGEAAAEQYRRTGYPDYGAVQNGLGYLTLIAAGLDRPLSAPFDKVELAYVKGFLVLDLLARTVGRERFHAILRRYLRAHAFRIARWRELQAQVEREAGQELGWFFRQWVDGTGAPDLALEWSRKGREVTARITQPAPGFRVEVEVAIEGQGRRETRRVAVAGPVTEARWTVGFDAARVVLDPHYEVLRWTPAYRALAAALVPFARWVVLDDPSVHEGLARAIAAVGPDDRIGLRFALEDAWGRVYLYEKKWAEAEVHLERALAAPGRPPALVPWTILRLARARRDRGDRAAMRAALESARRAAAEVGDARVEAAARAIEAAPPR